MLVLCQEGRAPREQAGSETANFRDQLRQVGGLEPAVLHQDMAVHHHQIDVAAAHRVNKIVVQIEILAAEQAASCLACRFEPR